MKKLFSRQHKPEGDGKTEAFTLEVLQTVPDGHRDKLESESRSCPQCSYLIHNPMTDRCPRCFAAVAPSDHTNCGECDYQGNCALAQIQHERGNNQK